MAEDAWIAGLRRGRHMMSYAEKYRFHRSGTSALSGIMTAFDRRGKEDSTSFKAI
jgi:hypothetical protein